MNLFRHTIRFNSWWTDRELRITNLEIGSLTAYIDLNTNELFLISYIQNRHS